MATATSDPQSSQSQQPARKPWRSVRFWILLFAAAIFAVFLWNYRALKGQAEIGTAYAAHIACSCRYIAGRDLESCKGDLEAGTEIVSLVDDPANKRITASVPLMSDAVAERRGDYGCIILNAQERSAID